MSDLNLVLPITPDNLHTELEHIEATVKKWREYIGQGIVGIDKPAPDSDEKLDAFLRQFTGEMFFVAGKCQNMAVVLSER